MCLTTTHKEFKTEKDITVYKAVIVYKKTGKWSGIYQTRKKFLFNELLTNKGKKEVWGGAMVPFSVYGGFFHSCKKLSDAMLHKAWIDDVLKDVKEKEVKIFKCTIPKDTICYKDDSGNWASRKIMDYYTRPQKVESSLYDLFG